MSTEIKERKRRPAARQKDVVLGCIEERLSMIPMTEDLEPHRARLEELLDELRRSLGKDESE
jgi:hypothetical protein